MAKTIDLLPRLSEKTYALSNQRVYVLNVERNLSKPEIKQAVESLFKVKVTSLKSLNQKGKSKRTISAKGRRVSHGRNSDLKKVYLTLAEGDSLPFFAAIEEEEKQAEKVQEEIVKQQAKETKKDEKTKKRRSVRSKKAEEGEEE